MCIITKRSLVRKYRQIFKGFIAPALSERPLPEISTSDLEELLTTLQAGDTSPVTVGVVKSVLNKIFHEARKEGLIAFDPMREVVLVKCKFQMKTSGGRWRIRISSYPL